MAKSKRDPNVLKEQQEARRLRREAKLKKKQEFKPTLTCVEVDGFVYKEEIDFDRLSSLRKELSSVKQEKVRLMNLAEDEGLSYRTMSCTPHFAGTGSCAFNEKLSPILKKLASLPKSILKIEKRYKTRLDKMQRRMFMIHSKISSLPKNETTELARLERLKEEASTLEYKFKNVLNIVKPKSIDVEEEYQLSYLVDIKSIEEEEKRLLEKSTDMDFDVSEGSYKMKDGSVSKASKALSTERFSLDLKRENLVNKIIALFTVGPKDILKERVEEFKYVFRWVLQKLKEKYDAMLTADKFVEDIRSTVKNLYSISYALEDVHMSEETMKVLPRLGEYIKLRKHAINYNGVTANNFSTMSDFQSLMIYRNFANGEAVKEWHSVVDNTDGKLMIKIRKEIDEYIIRQVIIDLLETHFGIKY